MDKKIFFSETQFRVTVSSYLKQILKDHITEIGVNGIFLHFEMTKAKIKDVYFIGILT